MTANVNSTSSFVCSLPRLQRTAVERDTRVVACLNAVHQQWPGKLSLLPISGKDRAKQRKCDPNDTLHLSVDDLAGVLSVSSPLQIAAILGGLLDPKDGVTISVRGLNDLLADMLRAVSTVTVSACSLEGRRAADSIRGVIGRMKALEQGAESGWGS